MLSVHNKGCETKKLTSSHLVAATHESYRGLFCFFCFSGLVPDQYVHSTSRSLTGIEPMNVQDIPVLPISRKNILSPDLVQHLFCKIKARQLQQDLYQLCELRWHGHKNSMQHNGFVHGNLITCNKVMKQDYHLNCWNSLTIEKYLHLRGSIMNPSN